MFRSTEHIGLIHEQKIAYMMKDLGERGLQEGGIAPIIYKVLWRFGINVVPPYFSTFWYLFLMRGVMYGMLFALISLPLAYIISDGPFRGFSIMSLLSMFVFAGVVFGLPVSVYYRIKANKLNLPPWSKYGSG